MLKIEEARAKLVELSGGERRVQGGSLQYRGGRFGFGRDVFEPSPDFLLKLCELIKVPYSLYRRCSPELQAHMLGEFAAGEDRYSVIVRNDKADSIGRARDVFIPIVNVFDTLATSLGGNIEFETVSLDRGTYTIEAVTNTAHAEPKPGDISYGGVLAQVGQFDGLNYRMLVGSYIQRLVCSNGLTRRESENTFVVKRMGTEGEALRYFGTLVSQTYTAVSSRYLPEFADTVNHAASDPTNLIRVIAKESMVPSDLVEGLMDLVPSLPPGPSVYDVVNLVTAFANNHSASRRRLLNAGGRIVDQTIQRCNQCHRAL